MADIIDFNQHRKKRSGNDFDDVLSPDTLMERLSTLPENGLMSSVSEAINDRMSLLLFLAEIGRQATDVLMSSGFDPDRFALDGDSLERFLSGAGDWDEDALWNGPFFDWDEDDFTVRLATTIRIEAEPAGDGMPLQLLMAILRLNEGDENWQRLTEDGRWVNDAPPAEYFDLMDMFPEDWEDDEDDADWDDEDWGEDSIFSLDLTPSILNALEKAGIMSVEALSGMTDAALLAVKGIGKKSLATIRRTLAGNADED